MPSEVFPNAPLQFVAFEVSFPPAAVDPPGLLDAVRGAVADAALEVTFAPPGVLRASVDNEPEAAMFRLVAFDRTVAVTVWRRALVIEHTDYHHWAEFERLVRNLLEALFETAAPTGVSRIGLRYVDEVHVPDVPETLAGWAPYLHQAFLWPTQLVTEPVLGSASGFSFGIGQDRAVNVRTATLPQSGLAAGGALRLRERPATAAFLLDCDGYFQPPDVDKSLDATGIIDICRELHTALDAVFHAAFTDKARHVFREKD